MNIRRKNKLRLRFTKTYAFIDASNIIYGTRDWGETIKKGGDYEHRRLTFYEFYEFMIPRNLINVKVNKRSGHTRYPLHV